MGDELNEQYGAEIELIAGSGGVFEVAVEGTSIFSKRKLNRFPEQGEVAALLGRIAK